MNSPQSTENALGYLIVEAKTADGALPVEDAVVTVSSTNGGQVKITVRTNQSGRTERLALPTKNAALSESPGTKEPYLTYDVTVHKDGYYPYSAYSVPIFSGVTSLQPAALIGLSAYNSDTVYPRGNTSNQNTEPFSDNQT